MYMVIGIYVKVTVIPSHRLRCPIPLVLISLIKAKVPLCEAKLRAPNGQWKNRLDYRYDMKIL